MFAEVATKWFGSRDNLPFVTRVIWLALVAGCAMVLELSAQTPANTVDLRPAPDVPSVVRGGTLPEIVVRGLRSADDPRGCPTSA